MERPLMKTLCILTHINMIKLTHKQTPAMQYGVLYGVNAHVETSIDFQLNNDTWLKP